MLLNGYVLSGPKKKTLLCYNPTWCDIIWEHGMNINAFEENRKTLQMYHWAMSNAGNVSIRITNTVLSELRHATDVIFFNYTK